MWLQWQLHGWASSLIQSDKLLMTVSSAYICTNKPLLSPIFNWDPSPSPCHPTQGIELSVGRKYTCVIKNKWQTATYYSYGYGSGRGHRSNSRAVGACVRLQLQNTKDESTWHKFAQREAMSNLKGATHGQSARIFQPKFHFRKQGSVAIL